MRQGVLFRERSGWAWWVHLLILACGGVCLWVSVAGVMGWLGGGGSSMSAWVAVFIAAIGLGLPALFYLLMGDLRGSVETDRVSVTFGRLGVIRKHIPLEEIKEVRAVIYSPLRDFGGWGIRIGTGGKTAWTVRGNRAVRMDLSNERIFFLGSDRPERMVDWIRSAKRRESE